MILQTIQKKFRLDLFHRLNTFTLIAPPVRDRPEDILELVRIYLKKYNKQYNRKTHIGYKAFEMLKSQKFPGNVRQLINIIKQAVALCDKRFLDDYLINLLTSKHSKSTMHDDDEKNSLTEKIEFVEKEMLVKAANICKTTREAAHFLSISQPSVVRKFKKYGIAMKNCH